VTLRAKLAIGFAVMAAVVTVIVGSASFFSTGNVLRRQVDASLDQAARRLEAGVGALPPSGAFPADRRGRDRDRGFEQILVQVLDVDGRVVTSPRGGELPVSDRDRRIAAGTGVRSSARRTVRIDGDEYRMLTVQVVDPADRSPNGAVQFARSLGETDTILRSIRNRTLLMVMLMSTIAALIGVVIARQVTKRLVHLTDAATAVAQSGQLDTPVPVDGDDETGRLGRAFQSMLNSLARSKAAQQQLVQDAGHELRTPLTSLRTNVAVMQRYDELSPASRQRLLADLESETRELSSLVDELVALATDQAADEPTSTVVLGEVAEQAAERAQRRWGRDIVVTRDGSAAVVRPQALDRAITNLVNNAIKFSDGPVEVSVAAGRVEVRDRGPGIAAADLDHLFDRFYRSEAARALPGSGLGLAIVRDLAESHGGSVFAANREGGGAVIGFVLPVVAGLPLPPPTGTGSTTPPG
jgi:two-component system sensor histidine kinase MprB